MEKRYICLTCNPPPGYGFLTLYGLAAVTLHKLKNPVCFIVEEFNPESEEQDG